MSEERLLPPDVAERYRHRLAEIRLTMPHWGGGMHRTTPEVEQALDANIGTTVERVMANVSTQTNAAPQVERCAICGAMEQLVGKRYVITHDFAKHPQGEVATKQLDVRPMPRTREPEDRIFGRQDYASGDRRNLLEVSF
jgi:hypothetical protein